MQQRIRWIEPSADPAELIQLRSMLRNRTEDGFPIPADPQMDTRDEVRGPMLYA
jgi:hypothetical protein